MDPGTVVHGRYTIVARAGAGGMSTVYRARDPAGNPVAVKTMTGGRPQVDARFIREARGLIELQHPGIVRCLDSGATASGDRFLVMEWLEGVDVATSLRSRPFSIAGALELCERVADALGYAHRRGIVHRDVKPSNLFLEGGQVERVKLLDFGVARWSSGASVTAAGAQVGTPAYMAPEQIRGDETIDPSADIFALGCVLFECLTGRVAFAAEQRMAVFYKVLMDSPPRISDLMADVPRDLDHLLARMLAKNPHERPSDGDAVRKALGDLRRGSTPTTWRRHLRRVTTIDGAITAGERHLVSVIIVARAADRAQSRALAEAADTSSESVRHEMPTGGYRPTQPVTALLASHTPERESQQRLEQLRVHHEAMGVVFDGLPDGSFIAVLDSRRAATDQAADAARCALDLARALSGPALAMATGRAEPRATQLLGELIERAAELLARAALQPGSSESVPAAGGSASGTILTGTILVDQTSAGLLSANFELRTRDSLTMLIGERKGGAEPLILGKSSPFVGRKREFATLRATLEESFEERITRVGLITGPPGIGKSRLRRELFRYMRGSLAGDDMEVWQGRGRPMRAGAPMHVIAQAIRGSADIRDDDPPRVRRDKLRARVARSLAPERVEAVAMFVGELINAPWPRGENVQLRAARGDNRLMGDRIRQACTELVTADCQHRPVLFLLEDFQHCSRATVAWFNHLLHSLTEERLVVLAFARANVHNLFPDLWSAHHPDEMQLRPLSRRSSHKLVEAILGVDVDGQRALRIVDQAAGNPLYLEELLRAAAAGRDQLPESVLAMVHSRLHELSPRARRVLRAASVFGERFWHGGVAAVLGDSTDADRYLPHLAEFELIDVDSDSQFADQTQYQFRHEGIHEAALGTFTDDDLRIAHRLAGAWLFDSGQADSLAVATHYELSDEPQRAISPLIDAARQACAAGDFEAAVATAERGRACGATNGELGALEGVAAEAYYWDGNLPAADACGERAIALLAPGTRAWYDAIGVASATRFRLGRPQPTELLPDTYPDGHDRTGWLRTTAALAGNLFLLGSLELADVLLARIAREEVHPARAAPLAAARIYRARAMRAVMTDGNPAITLRESLAAVACYRQAGDERHACQELSNVGHAQLAIGLHERARDNLRACLESAAGLGIDFLVDISKIYLSIALARSGAPDKAIVLVRSAVEAMEERGNLRMEVEGRAYLAGFLLRADDRIGALTEARRAVAQSPEKSPSLALALASLARILIEEHAYGAALQAAEQARSVMSALGGIDEGEALIRLVYAESLYGTGRRPEARLAVAEAHERLRKRAGLIDRPDWRRSFLTRVPDNARTVELYQRWH